MDDIISTAKVCIASIDDEVATLIHKHLLTCICPHNLKLSLLAYGSGSDYFTLSEPKLLLLSLFEQLNDTKTAQRALQQDQIIAPKEPSTVREV